MDKFGLNNLAIGIQNLIERQDLNNESHFVLKSETPYPYLQEFIQKHGDPALEPKLGQEERTLKDAFDLLSDQIAQSVHAVQSDPSVPKDNVSKLIRFKLEEFRNATLSLKTIFIELDDEDDAYIIFETLNTRGKDLEVSDLVKNHITRLVRPKGAQVDVAREKWNDMLLLFDNSAADINRNKFLLHSWLSKYEFTSEKKLFKRIKTRIGRENVQEYLESLWREAVIYRQILEPAFGSWTNEEAQLTRSLEALALFRVQQPLPMMMVIMRNYRSGTLSLKNAKWIVRCIENFHFIFTAITSQRSSGGISQMYALAARNLVEAQDQDQKMHSLRELLRNLENADPRIRNLRSISRNSSSYRHLQSNVD